MISTTPEILEMVRRGAAVAMAISGGKDSTIAALETSKFLDSEGHTGARILIHSDLGSVEWKDSAAVCQALADRLKLPLVIVERKAGGMMQRWAVRWSNNVNRYENLSCVKLILPWSTPSMRFCTSELKTSIICRELVKRFRGQEIINVTGVRREESTNRSKAAICKENTALARKDGTRGVDWLPIADMTTDQVFLAHRAHDFRLHEAYTKYGSTRVSCAFCIMGNRADLVASSVCADNADIYREMCELEITSAFSFQSAGWLSDIAPRLLSDDQGGRLARAKEIMSERERIEAAIPKDLYYEKGWPKRVPNYSEAVLLAEVRRAVGRLHGFDMKHTSCLTVIDRYKDLMREKEAKKK